MSDVEMKASADELLADRVESSRALGGNPEFCMHGGGNTSVKVERAGKRVMHVKGSGWDLATIEAEGLPGLWLDPLYTVQDGTRLSDTEMVRFLRSHLLDDGAPNPSVETLLHAYLPARFVDHGHASAVLAIADQPEARQREIVADLFGDGIAFLPYVFPGFDLSIEGARLAAAHPGATGMWLAHHGLFTWGETADESLDRFGRAVRACEDFLAKADAALVPPTERQGNPALDAVADRLVACLAGQGPFADGVHVDARGAGPLPELSARQGMADAVSRGTITPDHVIRIKPWPLVVLPDAPKAALVESLDRFASRYRAYFDENAPRAPEPLTMLDVLPRVAFVPGAGIIGLGRTPKEAAIHADLAEQNLRVVASAEAFGTYTPIPRHEQFLIEYWELEQAKLRGS